MLQVRKVKESLTVCSSLMLQIAVIVLVIRRLIGCFDKLMVATTSIGLCHVRGGVCGD